MAAAVLEAGSYKPTALRNVTMSDTERLWLAHREYGDESLVELVYASADGSRCLVKQFSPMLLRSKEITAAVDVDPEKVGTVEAEATRRRYAKEVERVMETHDPDDRI